MFEMFWPAPTFLVSSLPWRRHRYPEVNTSDDVLPLWCLIFETLYDKVMLLEIVGGTIDCVCFFSSMLYIFMTSSKVFTFSSNLFFRSNGAQTSMILSVKQMYKIYFDWERETTLLSSLAPLSTRKDLHKLERSYYSVPYFLWALTHAAIHGIAQCPEEPTAAGQ